MADSDMDISGDSDNESTAVVARNRESLILPIVPQEMVPLIPIPPPVSPTTASFNISKSKAGDRSTAHMPLKKRWRQSIEQEPKKRKVSLEAYRKRHASGGESGESGLSPSETENPSSYLRPNVKKDHRLAREQRDRQSGKKLQKMTISDLEKRKNKLKKALKQIEGSSSGTHDRKPNGNTVNAKSEFDKFMEKQGRWLEKRAREKQRDAKLEKFVPSLEMTMVKERNCLCDSSRTTKKVESDLCLSSGHSRSLSKTEDNNRSRDKRFDSHIYSPTKTKCFPSKSQKRVAVVRPRGQSELTSTLQCLQKAKEEVQRQLELLKAPHSDISFDDDKCRNSSVTKTVPVLSHSCEKSDI